MFPEEMQAVVAKLIFFIFATFALCFTKANAELIKDYSVKKSSVKLTFSV